MAGFEITIKERGYRPEPYAIADALIIADGKPIVSVTDLALQLSGTNRDELERLLRGWKARPLPRLCPERLSAVPPSGDSHELFEGVH